MGEHEKHLVQLSDCYDYESISYQDVVLTALKPTPPLLSNSSRKISKRIITPEFSSALDRIKVSELHML